MYLVHRHTYIVYVWNAVQSKLYLNYTSKHEQIPKIPLTDERAMVKRKKRAFDEKLTDLYKM